MPIVHLTVPASSIEKFGPMTLTGSLGGAALASETYAAAGAFLYRREVPPNLLAVDSVGVEYRRRTAGNALRNTVVILERAVT